MARPREFNETAVLEAAIQCFWSQGYEATSVRDLAENMGITGASLYNAFGDKRSLYRRALNTYIDGNVSSRVSRVESSLAPREAIETFFSDLIDHATSDKERKGCLVVNSALEVAP